MSFNRSSSPTDLRITDMRFVDITDAPKRCTIMKLITNQGLEGYGEVRDAASKTYALMLKSRILGENPCNVDKIFRKIKQFGGDSRQGGGGNHQDPEVEPGGQDEVHQAHQQADHHHIAHQLDLGKIAFGLIDIAFFHFRSSSCRLGWGTKTVPAVGCQKQEEGWAAGQAEKANCRRLVKNTARQGRAVRRIMGCRMLHRGGDYASSAAAASLACLMICCLL